MQFVMVGFAGLSRMTDTSRQCGYGFDQDREMWRPELSTARKAMMLLTPRADRGPKRGNRQSESS
jgi:hypothetical protein